MEHPIVTAVPTGHSLTIPVERTLMLADKGLLELETYLSIGHHRIPYSPALLLVSRNQEFPLTHSA